MVNATASDGNSSDKIRVLIMIPFSGLNCIIYFLIEFVFSVTSLVCYVIFIFQNNISKLNLSFFIQQVSKNHFLPLLNFSILIETDFIQMLFKFDEVFSQAVLVSIIQKSFLLNKSFTGGIVRATLHRIAIHPTPLT